MNTKPFARKILFATLLVCLFSVLILGVSGQRTSKSRDQQVSDTVPKTKKDKNVRDLDEALDELNKMDMEKIRKEFEAAMKELDMAKIKMDMEKAVKQFDMEKMQLELQNSIKKIDMDKINQQMQEALKEFDGEKMNKQMQEALKEFDAAKLEKQLQESINKVDWDKINAEFDAAKKIDMKPLEDQMKKVEEEMKKLEPEIEKQMEKAKVEIEKAKQEMKEYEDFTDKLEADRLINKKEDYTIEEKDGELMINGKKQHASVYNKYRSFLEAHKGMKIDKSDGNYNINRNKNRD
jgi:hypothetical protein